MHCIRVHQTGGPEVLRYESLDRPVPGPGQALVQVEAAGLNFIEVYQRTGRYKVALPFTPGTEAAGRIVALGAGVSGLKVGDAVASQNFAGSYAEYALAPADRLVPLPAGVSPQVGAAVMLQGMTAHYLACSTFPLASRAHAA